VNEVVDGDIMPVIMGGLCGDIDYIIMMPDGVIDDGSGLYLTVEDWIEVHNEDVQRRKVVLFTGTKQ